MHGDKSQSERNRVLESFLAGQCPVLVCTALLGRGIDLPNVSQVHIQLLCKEKVVFILKRAGTGAMFVEFYKKV